MKKMLKKSASVILSLILILCAVPFGAITASAETVTTGTTGDCTWTLDGTVLTISGNGDMPNYYYSGYGPWGTSISKVIIENGVISIGDYAFHNCTSLISIEIPDSVTSIGDYVFWNCTSLISIEIPDSVTSIGSTAFDGCTSLTSITIPDSVTSIGSSAFDGCTSLTSITIPDGVTRIDHLAFSNCTSLTSITIPDSVTSIGYYAFSNCTSLTSITIPDSVTSIGDSAFSDCTNLTMVNISNLAAWCNIDFEYSSSNPLYYAKNLYINENLATNIKIPDGVTSIGDYTFYNCTSLISITIPESVVSIGGSAFYGCNSLTSIDIPNTVTSIGGSAFSYCSSLVNISLSNSLTSISYGAFNGCENLTSIEIPDGVTIIEGDAFCDCSSLASITIPKSVTKIGSGYTSMGTFYGCNSLSRVYITDLAAWCGIEFDHYYSNPLYWAGKLYINGELAKNIEIPDGVTAIKDYTFVEGGYLESVTIPESVKSIGAYAFYECSKLESITIPKSVASIGSYAFYGCQSLIKADIRGEAAIIEEYTFGNCMNLKNVFLPDSLSLIKKYAFNNCYDLSDVYYEGDETAWSDVSILQYNDPLTNAAIHYNSTEIPKTVASIEIYSKPDKLKYYENTDSLDLTGGQIKVTYEDTLTEIIDITNSMVTGFDNMAVGTQTLTVTYGGKSATFDIEIIDNIYLHDFKDGICEICGARQFAIENATTSEPPFLYNGEYIYATYSVTYENSSEITIDMANSGYGDSDVMYVYDADYNNIGTYTADEMALNNITVKGDTVRLRLVSTSGDMTYNAEITVNYIYEKGDISGDFSVNAEDVALLRKSLIGTAELKIYQSANADITIDGKCDLKDFVALKKLLVGMN